MGVRAILTRSEQAKRHRFGEMTETEIRAAHPSSSTLATLEAMAQLARQTVSVIHVVVPREPGVVDHARRLASRVGVELCVDLLPRTARVRVDGQLS
jgi:hypothetical protein